MVLLLPVKRDSVGCMLCVCSNEEVSASSKVAASSPSADTEVSTLSQTPVVEVSASSEVSAPSLTPGVAASVSSEQVSALTCDVSTSRYLRAAGDNCHYSCRPYFAFLRTGQIQRPISPEWGKTGQSNFQRWLGPRCKFRKRK